jgi:RNA polymerase primary sigma factor
MKIEDINLFNQMNTAKKNESKNTYENIRNRIIEKNLKLVLSRVQIKYGFKNDPLKEDLVEAGNEGLIRAVETYDIEKGTEFSTYAVYWIDEYIHRELQKETTSAKIPYHKYQAIRQAIKKLENSNNEPTTQKLSEITGIKEFEVAQILEIIKKPVSLNYQPDESETELYELVNPNTDEIEKQVENNLLKEELLNHIKNYLTPKELDVIIIKYGLYDKKYKTLGEVGKIMNITKERVRQLESKALRKLKKISVKKGFADYMDEPDKYKK